MIRTGNYINQQVKLEKQSKKILKRYEVELTALYGEAFAAKIHTDATAFYMVIPGPERRRLLSAAR